MPAYTPPVSDLFTLGRCDWQQWHDYSRFHFTADHVPELIRMATDWPLMDHDDDEMIWAPVHAWRVLGLLATPEASQCLLYLLWNEQQDDFFVPEYLPDAAGRLGGSAVELLGPRIADPCLTDDERLLGVNALKSCGLYHPGLAESVVQILESILSNVCDDNIQVNSHIVVALVELGARQAIPAIEAAYERNCIDCALLGYIDDLENELSLKDKQPLVSEAEYDSQQEVMLAEFLSIAGSTALSLSGIKGLMFAMANAPVAVPPDRWLTIALGSENPQFASEDQGRTIRSILFNLLKSTQKTILDGKEVLPEECCAKAINTPEFDNLKEWSQGYGQGSNLLMDVWTDVLKHPKLVELEESWSSCMILLNVWSNADALIAKSEQGDGPDIEKMLEAMPAVAREMAVMSHDVRSVWKSATYKSVPVKVDKVGRNDPCPCGSGKKYKKCCGRSE